MTMVSAPAVSASVCGGAHDRLTEQLKSERTVRLVGGLDQIATVLSVGNKVASEF